MRFGLYYSGGLDWSKRPEPIANLGDMFACVPTERDYCDYAAAQLRELIDRYEPSVVWSDAHSSVIAPIALDGAMLTIRKFSADPFTDAVLISVGTIAAFAWSL